MTTGRHLWHSTGRGVKLGIRKGFCWLSHQVTSSSSHGHCSGFQFRFFLDVLVLPPPNADCSHLLQSYFIAAFNWHLSSGCCTIGTGTGSGDKRCAWQPLSLKRTVFQEETDKINALTEVWPDGSHILLMGRGSIGSRKSREASGSHTGKEKREGVGKEGDGCDAGRRMLQMEGVYPLKTQTHIRFVA